MDIRQFQYLAALAREKHFTRAASACNVTQPTLSGRIRQLEQELGVSIVKRGKRFEGLTPEGERVLKWGLSIIEDCGSLEQELAAIKGELAVRASLGVVRASSTPTLRFDAETLTDAVRQRYPRITFSIHSQTSREILGNIQNFSIDAGITYIDNEPVGKALTVPLYSERYRLFVRSDHRFANRETVTWAEAAGIPVVAPGKGLEDRITGGFDWLLSIANLSVLPEALIARAAKGAVNFHDGPLPRHAGLNAPVWARLAGETRHGITWHMIEGGVDEGDILEQVAFDITDEDTAFSLNARCYGAAIESFPAVVTALEQGAPNRRKQDLTQRTLHLRDDRPEAAARLDFRKPAVEVVRLVRALDHGGYWNPLAMPKIETVKGVFAVAQADLEAGAGVPGTVLETGDALVVACADGAVRRRCAGGGLR